MPGKTGHISSQQNNLAAVGFEPTPPKRLVPKTSALDRSATLPTDRGWRISNTSMARPADYA